MKFKKWGVMIKITIITTIMMTTSFLSISYTCTQWYWTHALTLWTVLKEARVSFELELIDNIKNKKREMTSYATIYYIWPDKLVFNEEFHDWMVTQSVSHGWLKQSCLQSLNCVKKTGVVWGVVLGVVWLRLCTSRQEGSNPKIC